MQRWLKSITPDRHTLEKLWCLRPFKSAVLDRGCWTFHRHSVTRAFALGLFVAFIPPTPLPVHLVACVILGMLFRLNLPVLIATVFLSNPFTWLPQVAASIWVGAKLMGMDLTPFLRVLHHHHLWMKMGQLCQLWAPLLLGALVLGSIAAGAGYVLAQFAWRARVIYHLRRRRARSACHPTEPARDRAATLDAHRGSR
jgi:uncharacterized protein